MKIKIIAPTKEPKSPITLPFNLWQQSNRIVVADVKTDIHSDLIQKHFQIIR